MKRENDTLIKGPSAIYNYYASKKSNGKITLTRTPDFIDVSKSKDLTYLYQIHLENGS